MNPLAIWLSCPTVGAAKRLTALAVIGVAALCNPAPVAAVNIKMDVAAQGTAVAIGGSAANYYDNYVANLRDWETTCQNVNGSTAVCNHEGRPVPTSPLLFSWGHLEDSSTNKKNSVLQITYTGAAPIKLNSINLSSIGNATSEPLGPLPGLKTTNPAGMEPSTGFGSMVIYGQPEDRSTAPGSLKDQRSDEQLVKLFYINADEDEVPMLEDAHVLAGASSYLQGDDPDNPTGFVRFAVDRTFTFDDVDLSNGDSFFLQFYETDWNNGSYWPDQNLPDAYYGPMEVTLNAAVIEVTGPELVGRAGTAAQPGEVTVTNTGVGTFVLKGQMDAVTNVTGLSATPNGDQVFLDPSGNVGLESGESAKRTFAFTPLSELELGTTVPQETDTIQQTITSNDPDPENTSFTQGIKGTTVGPVLGVYGDADRNPSTPADWLEYESAIDLGDVNLDSEVTAEFLLRNLFEKNYDDLTDLTIFNIGIYATKDGTDAYSGPFSIRSGGVSGDGSCNPDPDDSSQCAGAIALNVQQQASDPLIIAFDPSSIKTFNAFLRFTTDMNSPFQVANANDIWFKLTGTGTGTTGAPLPGSAWLLLIGLLSLGIRWRAAGRA